MTGRDGTTEPQPALSGLVAELDRHPWKAGLIRARETAQTKREAFLQMYPFRENPAAIAEMTARQHAEGLITWLELELRWLGGINLRSRKPHQAAGRHIGELRRLLRVAVDPNKTVFNKVDAQWGNIPWFGGEDRQIAKKIVATYYPEDTLPIFNTGHLEHFVSYLGLRAVRNAQAQAKFGRSYGDMLTVGQKWEVLTELLLGEKARNPVLQAEDNVWFMYCLYCTRACPPKFKVPEPPG